MAEPEGVKPNPNPDAAKPAAPAAVDATKYVGTPAGGTSKAAAAAGHFFPRAHHTHTPPRPPRLVLGGGTALLTPWVLALFQLFLPRPLFSPHSVFSNLS